MIIDNNSMKASNCCNCSKKFQSKYLTTYFKDSTWYNLCYWCSADFGLISIVTAEMSLVMESYDNEDCPVCLENLFEKMDTTNIQEMRYCRKCQTNFCTTCFDTMADMNICCPICRTDL